MPFFWGQMRTSFKGPNLDILLGITFGFFKFPIVELKGNNKWQTWSYWGEIVDFVREFFEGEILVFLRANEDIIKDPSLDIFSDITFGIFNSFILGF